MKGMNKEETILSIVEAGEMEIDTEGRIWRVAKRGGNPQRGSFATRPCPRVRAEYATRGGYLLVATTIRGVRTVTGAHRIVWTYFNAPIPNGLSINHKNGVKDDNSPENLELATYSQQRIHAIEVLKRNKWHPIGSLHPKTHITESDVLEIRRLRAEGQMIRVIAATYGMQKKAISAICNRRTWKHV
jgi:hypothetical protein